MTRATDINTDPNCSSTMDPNVALGSRLGPDKILAKGGSTGHSDKNGSAGSMPWAPTRTHVVSLNQVIHTTFGGNTDLGCNGTKDMVLAAAGSGCHHYPRWQCTTLRTAQPQWQHGLWTPTWPEISGINVALNERRNSRHQHRLWMDSIPLYFGQGPRHGP